MSSASSKKHPLAPIDKVSSKRLKLDFLEAVVTGEINIVKEHLQHNRTIVSIPSEVNGHTALELAVLHKRLGVARALLDAKANVNDYKTGSPTPIIRATLNGDLPMVRLLLERNALVSHEHVFEMRDGYPVSGRACEFIVDAECSTDEKDILSALYRFYVPRLHPHTSRPIKYHAIKRPKVKAKDWHERKQDSSKNTWIKSPVELATCLLASRPMELSFKESVEMQVIISWERQNTFIQAPREHVQHTPSQPMSSREAAQVPSIVSHPVPTGIASTVYKFLAPTFNFVSFPKYLSAACAIFRLDPLIKCVFRFDQIDEIKMPPLYVPKRHRVFSYFNMHVENQTMLAFYNAVHESNGPALVDFKQRATEVSQADFDLALLEATWTCNLDSIKLLLELGARPNANIYEKIKSCWHEESQKLMAAMFRYYYPETHETKKYYQNNWSDADLVVDMAIFMWKSRPHERILSSVPAFKQLFQGVFSTISMNSAVGKAMLSLDDQFDITSFRKFLLVAELIYTYPNSDLRTPYHVAQYLDIQKISELFE